MREMMEEGKEMSILMLPWLAHGHIAPYLQLAKTLTHSNFTIYLCTTPVNLRKLTLPTQYSASIKLLQLHLPSSPHLPPHYHTTNGLPHHLMIALKDAFDLAGPAFSDILVTIKPRLLIYDFCQPWAADIASAHNIPAVQFLTGSASFNAFGLHILQKPGQSFPFPQLWPHGHLTGQPIDLSIIPDHYKKDMYRFLGALERSNSIVLIKTAMEVEKQYIDYMSVLSNKKIIPVGPLVEDATDDSIDDRYKYIIEWLDKTEENSVVFVSFGSEYFLSKDEMEEIANGLEMSNMNFIWVVRFPVGENTTLKEALPNDFVERVRNRGMVIEGWAPQTKILKHKSTGGFVSHCGWSSVMESMKFGVPMIAMPMQLDQPVNARLVAEVGVGVEVARGKNGKREREQVAAAIKQVVAEKSGEIIRNKAKDLSDKIKSKGEEEIDRVVNELLLLICCGN